MKTGIKIVPLDRHHLGFMRNLRNDERINQWLISPAVPLSESDEAKWFYDVYVPGNDRILILEVSGEMIGYGQVCKTDHFHRSAEVGIVVEPNFQGRGYGQALMDYLLKFCFIMLGLHRVWLRIFSHNERAIGFYRKYGFAEEGTLRDAARKNGRYCDVTIMSILEDGYFAEGGIDGGDA